MSTTDPHDGTEAELWKKRYDEMIVTCKYECEQRDAARAAFGEHPDSPLALAARIRELRDETRGMFHANTKLAEKIRELKAANDLLAALTKS